jgi:hypothetical protein
MHSHELAEADRGFRDAFEAFEIAPTDFGHESHVRLAYVYLAETDVESAVQRMRQALLAFLEHHNIPRSKFHETLTRSWILAVRHFMNKSASTSADDFISKNPELLDSRIMLTHYSASVLFSAEARESYIEPDLDPIPNQAGPSAGKNTT